MFKNESVSARVKETSLLSSNVYNLVIGAVLLWGFAINWYLVENVSTEALKSINIWVLLIGYFVSCFAGIAMFTSSDKPIVSFIGYNLVVVPFGLVLNLFLADVSPTIVSNAVQTTALVTFGMMVLGTIFPSFFAKIETGLFWALVVAIVVELFQMLIFKIHLGIMDWIVAIIFCGYIGVDWGRANSAPKTLDNAIDGAAALYMDIINLFVRIVSIMNSDD